jgi:TrmH family RNA methyltransferase
MTRKQMSYVRSLRQGKFRKIHGQFLAEGPKVVDEFLHSDFKFATVYATEDWFEVNLDIINQKEIRYEIITESELTAISRLKEPNQVVSVIYQKEIPEEIDVEGLTLALYAISDPGNMGTILRSADWFGIKNVFCSFRTVDVYNPKVVQASMGSLSRLNVTYLDFEDLFAQCNEVGIPVYGTVIDGKNFYDIDFVETGMIVIGNESNGIKEKYLKLFDEKISIPSYNGGQTESLNAAVATSIIVSEIRRKLKK